MAKFNKRTTRAEMTPSGLTYEGAPGYARDAKSELFLLAVANMVGERTFYESAGDRDSRYQELVRRVAVEDAGWLLAFLGWLRGDGNMRSAALVGAAEAVKARLEANVNPSRSFVSAVLQRADEPGELLAYWMSRYGRAIPKPVKRGIGDAVRRLYTERALLKYDTGSHGYRFGDVLDLTHPAPATDKPWQGELFKLALDRRHHRQDIAIHHTLRTLVANHQLRLDAVRDPTVLLDVDRLTAAGSTWEGALSLAGSTVDKARLWSALIPSMGYMALLRNLRNFDEAGVPDDVAARVAERLAAPAQVKASRQLPMRFLSAYRAVRSLRWGHALDKALTASLANVPVLAGRTLILVDVSASMTGLMSVKSDLNCADAAVVFGAALALRTDPTLVWFNDRSGRVMVPKRGSLLKLVDSIPRPNGGTYTAAAVEKWYSGHDRVVIVTDEQAHYGGQRSVDAPVPRHVPVYTWNIAGYRLGHAPSGTGTRYTFGGLTDAAFRMIPLLEAGRDAVWPWQVCDDGES
ncbi:MAG TPA: TROVE domain-containing protein [Micromonosporaceae bacterium]|nr:TROVE domain-containing protein [Micromonosporaceae bacterium]